jgi:hypothetical protein
MEEPGKEVHLDIGGVVVCRGIIGALLVGKHLGTLLVRERTTHVNVLRPAASDTLVEQHLVAYPASFGSLEES